MTVQIIKENRCGRKWTWPVLGYYPPVACRDLGKPQELELPVQDLNPVSVE
jgi:hypothetical protein